MVIVVVGGGSTCSSVRVVIRGFVLDRSRTCLAQRLQWIGRSAHRIGQKSNGMLDKPIGRAVDDSGLGPQIAGPQAIGARQTVSWQPKSLRR